jgi:hypothetical protein
MALIWRRLQYSPLGKRGGQEKLSWYYDEDFGK